MGCEKAGVGFPGWSRRLAMAVWALMIASGVWRFMMVRTWLGGGRVGGEEASMVSKRGWGPWELDGVDGREAGRLWLRGYRGRRGCRPEMAAATESGKSRIGGPRSV